MLTDGTITLRAPEPADIDIMYLWENDPLLWIDGAVRAPMSRQLLHDFVMSYNPDPNASGQMRLIIESNATRTAAGCIDLYEYDAINRRAGVGIVISREHHGRGYASAALELMKLYCGQHLGLHQLWAIINRENEPSVRLFTGAGFKTCGSLRSWIRIGNTYRDALMYQLIL